MVKSDKKRVLTGDRPSGRLHLGHFVGSLQNRLKMQGTHEVFVEIADVQALTDNFDNPQKVRDNVHEVLLDYLAVGLDPKKTTFFVQSAIPQIPELTMYFLNLVTLARLKRNPTVKSEMKDKGYGDNVPAGFLMYPVNQAADILAFKADEVPVGEDQLPMIEQTNEILEKFNRLYGEVFKKVKGVVGDTPRLSGIDGKAKMSKSLNNAIYLSDSAEEVEKKVMKMYTDELHINIEDEGHIEGNVVFEYLDIFDKNKDEVEDLKTQYKKGGLGDVVLKKRLIGVLNDFLEPIRERRASLEGNKRKLDKILEKGTKNAQKVAEGTMEEVRKAMKIDYFK